MHNKSRNFGCCGQSATYNGYKSVIPMGFVGQVGNQWNIGPVRRMGPYLVPSFGYGVNESEILHPANANPANAASTSLISDATMDKMITWGASLGSSYIGGHVAELLLPPKMSAAGYLVGFLAPLYFFGSKIKAETASSENPITLGIKSLYA